MELTFGIIGSFLCKLAMLLIGCIGVFILIMLFFVVCTHIWKVIERWIG